MTALGLWLPAALRGGRRRRRGAVNATLLAVSVLLTSSIGPLRAEETVSTAVATDRSVKAAFLYKFLAFVDWPQSAFLLPDTPLIIGVVGADELAAELDQITSGRTLNNHPILIRRMRDGDTLAGLQVLFVGRTEATRLSTIAARAAQRPILTVTDLPGGLDQGMAITFVNTEGRVRFEISVEAAERSGLKLSSRLLAVAQAVRTGS
ncbi:MAG: YfiR family protein [Casimicrobiaceae bacterium]